MNLATKNHWEENQPDEALEEGDEPVKGEETIAGSWSQVMVLAENENVYTAATLILHCSNTSKQDSKACKGEHVG